MADFSFLFNPTADEWTIIAPRRKNRPNTSKGTTTMICPFCIGTETKEQEIFRIGGSDHDQSWQVRVVPNKYPFAPVHEIIIHSPDHHKNFDELPLNQVELIIKAYKQRFTALKRQGNVLIFHNHAEAAGESLPHPHTQLVVIPSHISMRISPRIEAEDPHETDYFQIYCPKSAEWPDEIWISPKRRNISFDEITEEELGNLAIVLQRSIQLLDVRHGEEFPFNFFIYPGKDWYLRIVPRLKILGGFEVATDIFVNTIDPFETNTFIKTHFDTIDIEHMEEQERVDYAKRV